MHRVIHWITYCFFSKKLSYPQKSASFYYYYYVFL